MGREYSYYEKQNLKERKKSSVFFLIWPHIHILRHRFLLEETTSFRPLLAFEGYIELQAVKRILTYSLFFCCFFLLFFSA